MSYINNIDDGDDSKERRAGLERLEGIIQAVYRIEAGEAVKRNALQSIDELDGTIKRLNKVTDADVLRGTDLRYDASKLKEKFKTLKRKNLEILEDLEVKAVDGEIMYGRTPTVDDEVFVDLLSVIEKLSK